MGHALTCFIIEFSPNFEKSRAIVVCDPPKEMKRSFMEALLELWWTLHVDGAMNNDFAGADIVLISPEGHNLISAIHFLF